MKTIWTVACALLLGTVCASAQGAGHRVTADQVVVNSQQHWQNWSFGAGTLDIGADGEVRPRRLRKNINAVENAREFLRLNPPNYIKKTRPISNSAMESAPAPTHGAYWTSLTAIWRPIGNLTHSTQVSTWRRSGGLSSIWAASSWPARSCSSLSMKHSATPSCSLMCWSRKVASPKAIAVPRRRNSDGCAHLGTQQATAAL